MYSPIIPKHKVRGIASVSSSRGIFNYEIPDLPYRNKSCVLDMASPYYKPGAQTKIFDRTSYNNDGTITGASWEQLPSGLWVQNFDGTDDIVTVADSANLSALSPITVMCWFNQDIQGDEGLVSKFGSAGTNREWSLEITSGLLAFWETVTTYPTDYLLAQGTLDVSDQKFHFGVAAWDGVNAAGHISLYTDGIAEVLTTDSKVGTGATAWDSTAPVEIGRTTQNNTFCFDGRIALARVIKCYCSASEVYQIYQRERPLFRS